MVLAAREVPGKLEWYEMSDGSTLLAASTDRDLMIEIQAGGLASVILHRLWYRYDFIKYSWRQVVARLNVCEELFRLGNRWDSLPASVREHPLVCESPHRLGLCFIREWRFLELVKAGLPVVQHFPPELVDGGVRPKAVYIGGCYFGTDWTPVDFYQRPLHDEEFPECFGEWHPVTPFLQPEAAFVARAGRGVES